MRMRALPLVAPLLLLLLLLAASAPAARAQETPDALREAPGREAAFYTRIACPGTAGIRPPSLTL